MFQVLARPHRLLRTSLRPGGLEVLLGLVPDQRGAPLANLLPSHAGEVLLWLLCTAACAINEVANGRHVSTGSYAQGFGGFLAYNMNVSVVENTTMSTEYHTIPSSGRGSCSSPTSHEVIAANESSEDVNPNYFKDVWNAAHAVLYSRCSSLR